LKPLRPFVTMNDPSGCAETLIQYAVHCGAELVMPQDLAVALRSARLGMAANGSSVRFAMNIPAQCIPAR
jgi:hypothetical protein